MKWFKHMTASARDEKIALLEAEFGLEGIGFYWRVLEIIAGEMDANLKTSVRFPTKIWAKLFGISAKKFQNLAEFCENVNLFSLKIDGDLVTIDCPKLLTIKDERTSKDARNMSKSPDKVRTKSGLDIDVDIDIKEEFNTPLTPLSGGPGEVEEFSPLPPSASPAKKELPETASELKTKPAVKPAPRLTREQEFEQALEAYTQSAPVQEAFKAYRDMRKAINKPLTAPALKLAFGKLDSLAATDADKVAVLEQSTLNSWQSLYELKQDKVTASHVPKAFKSFAQQRLEANKAACEEAKRRLFGNQNNEGITHARS